MNDHDDTYISRLYQAGDLDEVQYRALVSWREDGGGVRSGPAPVRKGGEQDYVDFMVAAARNRHREAKQLMERVDYEAALATHRCVMMDRRDQQIELLAKGARILVPLYGG